MQPMDDPAYSGILRNCVNAAFFVHSSFAFGSGNQIRRMLEGTQTSTLAGIAKHVRVSSFGSWSLWAAERRRRKQEAMATRPAMRRQHQEAQLSCPLVGERPLCSGGASAGSLEEVAQEILNGARDELLDHGVLGDELEQCLRVLEVAKLGDGALDGVGQVVFFGIGQLPNHVGRRAHLCLLGPTILAAAVLAVLRAATKHAPEPAQLVEHLATDGGASAFGEVLLGVVVSRGSNFDVFICAELTEDVLQFLGAKLVQVSHVWLRW